MAVTATPKAAKVQIKYLGEIVNGKQTYVSKTYSKVKPQSADQDIYDTVLAIVGLQKSAVYSVTKSIDSEMAEA